MNRTLPIFLLSLTLTLCNCIGSRKVSTIQQADSVATNVQITEQSASTDSLNIASSTSLATETDIDETIVVESFDSTGRIETRTTIARTIHSATNQRKENNIVATSKDTTNKVVEKQGRYIKHYTEAREKTKNKDSARIMLLAILIIAIVYIYKKIKG